MPTGTNLVRLMDRTFIICKPDAVARGLVGEILARFERRDLKIVALEMRVIDEKTARAHYAEHEGKPFLDGLVQFMTGGPAVMAVIEGPQDTWQVARTMMGATNALLAAPGTIRGDFGNELPANLIHGSDSAESAARRNRFVFPEALTSRH